MVVFDTIPADQLKQYPYWTEVDDIAQISPSELIDFTRSHLDLFDSIKPLPKSSLINGRRIFETSSTPTRINSPRTVTFSPRVDIQPIETNKWRQLAEKNARLLDQRDKTRQPQMKSVLNDIAISDNIRDESLSQSREDGDESDLFDDLLDLVPPDFDIIDHDLQKLYVASATNDCDSDSVSGVSSSDEGEGSDNDYYDHVDGLEDSSIVEEQQISD